MTDRSKISPSHLQRAAMVYLRQSTPGQVEHNRESTARQYALADLACQLGWSKQQVILIDEDLGLSGASTDKRSGFARLTSEVALAHVGIVLGLEVSRLARNNADWYRLLECVPDFSDVVCLVFPVHREYRDIVALQHHLRVFNERPHRILVLVLTANREENATPLQR
jgi:hypothetical protein